MQTIFEIQYSDEIVKRIENLSAQTQPKWGKMDVAQMLAHCSSFQNIAMGNSVPPRGLLGILVGRFAKPIFYNDKALPHNMSTIPTIIISDKRDFELEKENLKQLIQTFQHSGPETIARIPHPFFGKLTSDQWGKGIYKHLDHHLRQFGV